MSNQLQHSDNLQMQLEQRKDKFLSAVPKLMDSDSQPIVEKIIAASFTGNAINYIDIKDRENREVSEEERDKQKKYFGLLVDFIGNWRLMVGAMKNVDAKSLQLEVAYLHTTYGHLKFAEVKAAVDLMMQHKLDMKLMEYNNFSPLFISTVLEKYLSLKRELVSEVIKIADQPKELAAPEPSLEEKTSDMKFFITECKRHFTEGGKQNFINNMVYKFLRRTKRLVFDDQIIESAKLYSKKEYAKYLSDKPLNLNAAMNADTKEAMLKQFSIDFCLKHFFENNDLQVVLDAITTADYQFYKDIEEAKRRELESMQAFCKHCKRMTGPAHHSGCDQHKNPACAWHIEEPINPKK
jgi:hypothetical protein